MVRARMANFKTLAEARRRSFERKSDTTAMKKGKDFMPVHTIEALGNNVMIVPQDKSEANLTTNLVD